MEAPILVVLRSEQAFYSTLQWDGSFHVNFRLPKAVVRAKEAKLLFVEGGPAPLVCTASFVKPQVYGEEAMQVLGTSVPQSNVYVPVNNIPSIGWLSFARLDGKPLQDPPDLLFAVHVM